MPEIPGWMTQEEMAWLSENASRYSDVVEIGSYQGRSTRALASAKRHVYAVDDWKGLREDWWIESTPKTERDSLYESFLDNTQDILDSGKLVIVKQDHDSVLPFPCDMVFIDGDHRYESVKRDIEKWLPYVREGGLICGHDSDQWPVMQAVDELLPGSTKPAGLIWQWTK